MAQCPFCSASLIQAPRCPRCGWGPYDWPWQNPPWEEVTLFSISGAWIITLFQLLKSPRFFFRSLADKFPRWRAWTFGLPLVFLMLFTTIMSLPRVLQTLPLPSEQGWDFLYDATIVPLAQMGFGQRFGSVFLFFVEAAAFWFLLLAALSSLLYLGLVFSGPGKWDWFRTFRLTGYVMAPFLVVVVASQTLLSLDPEIGFPPEGYLPTLVGRYFMQALKILMILWPYFVTLIALEEYLKINRLRAQMVILISTILGFIFLSVSGQFFG